ncbi:MAG TPA: ankyrin repeat domain-containing protein [Longimicrobiales bacterium]|nr:ankyrin repeat domain-containing protein [Longimicrobiales bacterium]
MKTSRALPLATALALALTAFLPAGWAPIAPATLDAATLWAWVDAPVADAAQTGDVDQVRTLLRQGEDVNASQGDGMTALHWAAYQGNLEMIEVLIYAGSNLEAVTRVADYTPLMVAARTGHGDAAVLLLDAGANPSATTSTGVTALHFAAGAGQTQAVRALVAAGVDVDARESAMGQTPLIFAANEGRKDAVQVLIDAGGDVNATTKVVPVDQLERQERIESQLRRARLEARENLEEAEAQASLDMTELTWTQEQRDSAQAARDAAEQARADSIAAVRAEAEARRAEREAEQEDAEEEDENSVDEEEDDEDEEEEEVERRRSYGDLVGGIGGLSPLHHAARQGHRDAAMALLDAGAEIDMPAGGDQSTPMVLAAINGHFDLALELMARGADPTMSNHADVTPLWAAINLQWAPRALYPQPKNHLRQEVDYLGFMRALLEAGADPNAPVNRHIWFMSYNFDLLGVNMTGATPFWRAAYALDIPAMELLVEYGADPNEPSKKPPTGRSFDPDAEDDSGLPPVPVGGPGVHPIHAASGVGYGQDFAANSHEHAPDGWLPAVKYLVETHGADVNARDQDGYTPLHHAAARGDNELIMYLVEQGADVMAVGRNGNTTADMANAPISRVEPFPETIELLVSMGAVNNDNCRSCE